MRRKLWNEVLFHLPLLPHEKFQGPSTGMCRLSTGFLTSTTDAPLDSTVWVSLVHRRGNKIEFVRTVKTYDEIRQESRSLVTTRGRVHDIPRVWRPTLPASTTRSGLKFSPASVSGALRPHRRTLLQNWRLDSPRRGEGGGRGTDVVSYRRPKGLTRVHSVRTRGPTRVHSVTNERAHPRPLGAKREGPLGGERQGHSPSLGARYP